MAALFGANLLSLQVFVVAAVAATTLWTWDLTVASRTSGIELDPYPPLVALAAAAWGGYRWGFDGYAIGTLLGVLSSLASAVLRPRRRSLAALANTALAGLLASLAVGSLALLRLRWDLEVNALLLVIAVALAGATAARQLQYRLPLLDPNIAALSGAALAGVIAGSASSLSLSTAFVASVAASGGLVAGNAAGSLLRWGRISLVMPAPGWLTMIDGAMLAAPVFWLTMVVLTA